MEKFDFTEFDAALKRSGELFEKVFICEQDSIIVLDDEYIPRIFDCNPVTEKVFGYSREELVGQPIRLLYTDGESLKEHRRFIISSIIKEGFCCIDEIDLDKVFQSVKEQFSQRAQALGVRLSPRECSVKLCAGRVSLIRALGNLTENALKYGGDRLNEISLGYLESDEFHIISVKDDGTGLNGEDKMIDSTHIRGRTLK
jgi:hypothetical protein